MAIILKRVESKAAKYFPEIADQDYSEIILEKFRRIAADDNRMANILDMMDFTFSDEQIFGFIKDSIEDINSGFPRSDFSVSTLGDISMITNGALVHAFMSKGILKIKNSVPINDQGVQINMYEQGPQFQSIAQYYAQEFQQQKANLKGALHYRNMFVGIESEYSYM